MAKVELGPGEQVLTQGVVLYLKSRFYLIDGAAYLTDRRFLRTTNMRGPAGGLVGTVFRGKVDIELPLGWIARISRGKHHRIFSLLEIETVQGEIYRLMPMRSVDEWLRAFAEALAAHHGLRLVESAPGQWRAEPG
jgi:hypothetical protein